MASRRVRTTGWGTASNCDATLARSRDARSAPAERPQLLFVAILVGAAFCNAFLAWLVARGMYVGNSLVVTTEAVVLAGAVAMILASGRRPSDTTPALFGLFFVVATLAVSLGAQFIFPAMARNAAIIALFLMLGSRTNEATIKLTVAVITLAVLVVLIVEIAYTATYVSLFEPARYFELTRGMEPLDFMDGLYAGASGFEGRFAIADFLGHRASSLFLEQVSLGNFGIVLVIYLIGFWNRHRLAARLFYGSMIALILVTTNSRMLFAFIAIAPLVYLTGGAFYRNQRLLILPVVLLISSVIYTIGPETQNDDLLGRIGKTMRSLIDMDVPALFGARPYMAAEFTDSGYTFVIYSASIFALLALWIFASGIMPDISKAQRRMGLAVCLYVFMNLLVSGTSLFSIKVAALLWFVTGFVRVEAEVRQARSKQTGHPQAQQGVSPVGWPRKPGWQPKRATR